MKNVEQVTIIIPVRKEEEVIGKTLETLQLQVKIPFRVLIADDHVDKQDRTIEIARKYAKSWVNIRIAEKKPGDRDGFGPALARAVQLVTTPAAVFVMADLSDELMLVTKMWRTMQKENADVVAGCRYMVGATKNGGPWLQGILSTFLNGILPLITMIRTRDATNAFKLWRTEALKELLPQEPELSLVFSLQLSVLAAKRRLRVVDLPTKWSGRTGGKSKFKIVRSGWPYIKWSMQAVRDRMSLER